MLYTFYDTKYQQACSRGIMPISPLRHTFSPVPLQAPPCADQKNIGLGQGSSPAFKQDNRLSMCSFSSYTMSWSMRQDGVAHLGKRSAYLRMTRMVFAIDACIRRLIKLLKSRRQSRMRWCTYCTSAYQATRDQQLTVRDLFSPYKIRLDPAYTPSYGRTPPYAFEIVQLAVGQLVNQRFIFLSHSASLTCCASLDLKGADRTCSALRCWPDNVGLSVHSCASAYLPDRDTHVDYTCNVLAEDLSDFL